MLFRETVTVYCENHMEHTNTLCGQKAEFYYVTAGGTYGNHCALKDKPVTIPTNTRFRRSTFFPHCGGYTRLDETSKLPRLIFPFPNDQLISIILR
jgi:hypothetical protein